MEVHVDDFSGTDTERLKAASVATQFGGIIELSDNTIYEIDSEIVVYDNQLWKGWNSSFKRKDTPTATVAGIDADDDKILYVDDSSGFKIGDFVIAVYGNAFSENRGHQNKYISDVGNNYIRVNIPAQIGDIIIHEFDMFKKNTGGKVRFEGVNFDGNINNNSYTHDWRCNTTTRGRGYWEFYGCEFMNTPSENIIAPSSIVDSCKGKNLGGSFVHISANPDERKFTRVTNCDVDGVNLIGNAIMNHSEAAITFSNNSKNVALVGNSFTNAHHILGIVGNDDGDVIVQSNYFSITGNVIIGSQVVVGNNIVINTN